jgi:bifunctional DNA-binding transcriptional regulator/antitoxin component of YhaV-PrlF toxin-antitoxin module
MYPFKESERNFIDKNGNIYISESTRKQIGLELGEEIKTYVNDTKIIHIEKVVPSCLCCGTFEEKVAVLFECNHINYICQKCLEDFIKKHFE